MTNFFSDIAERFKLLPALGKQLYKTAESQRVARETEKRLTETTTTIEKPKIGDISGGFFGDIAQKYNLIKPQEFVKQKIYEGIISIKPLLTQYMFETEKVITKEELIANENLLTEFESVVNQKISKEDLERGYIKIKSLTPILTPIQKSISGMTTQEKWQATGNLTKELAQIFPKVIAKIGVSFIQLPETLKTGKGLEPVEVPKLLQPIVGEKIISSYAKDTEQAILAGANPVSTILLTGLFVGWDALIAGSLLKFGSQMVMRGVKIPETSHYGAWEVLGRAETKQEALKTADDLLRVVSPQSSRAQRLGTVNEEATTAITSARNIINKQGIPKAPPRLLQVIRDIAETLNKPISEIMKAKSAQPFLGVRGYLPGEAIVGEPQPAFGLSIKPVKKVGGVPEVPKELQALADLGKNKVFIERAKTISNEELSIIDRRLREVGIDVDRIKLYSPPKMLDAFERYVEKGIPLPDTLRVPSVLRAEIRAIPKELEPLAAEARKYGSVEEFERALYKQEKEIMEFNYAEAKRLENLPPHIEGTEKSVKRNMQYIGGAEKWNKMGDTAKKRLFKIANGEYKGVNLTDFYNQAVGGEVKPATDEKLSQALDELRVAEEGRRTMITPPSYMADPYFIGEPSTFPDWLPKRLRDKKLLDSVVSHFENNTLPKEGTREAEIYDLTLKRAGKEPKLEKLKLVEKEMTPEEERAFFDKLWPSAPEIETIGIVPPKEPPRPPVAVGATPEPFKLSPQKKMEITRSYAKKVRQDIEALGGLENENIVQDLNEIGGYKFKDIGELKSVLTILEKVLKPIRAKDIKMTAEEREINKMIMRVEKEQKTLLLKEQREAIVNLQKIAKPSEATMFYKKEEIQSWIRAVKELQSEKELSNMTVSRIKKSLQIENLKQTGQPQLQKLREFLTGLKKGDAFLSEKQVVALSDLLKGVENLELAPKRVLIDQFGEKTEIMAEGITGRVLNELVPTVDIKEGHPLVTRITDKADNLLFEATEEISRRDKNFEEMISKAEKSRKLPIGEKIKRAITPQNKEIFAAMGGEKVALTREEAAVVAYLRNFFKKVRDDLKLEKYRQNYITHLEKDLTEKILTDGVLNSVIDIFKLRKSDNIPLNVMLELDNIIGSEKFFRFALERKGGISPTTNIRKILHDYSSLYETKKALDSILPEGQAIVQLLLKPKTAVWTKKFLQNLKGRGLDTNFRTGKMGWLAKVADGIIDISYTKLLGLNYWSALKNIVAGEANSFITQDLRTYLLGKQRFITHPRKSVKMALDYGVLEGTYVDYAQQGINKFKKARDLLMFGMKVGEYEMRTSVFVARLTPEEWASEKISVEKIRKIKDDIAITQGIFSKTDSPLWVQAWYGRMIMQMNRWRITNAMLVRRLIKDKNYAGLSKAFILYGVGLYLAYELRKAGYKQAAKVARAMGETINSIVEAVTTSVLLDTIRKNPTISILGEFVYDIQRLANYVGIAEEPRKIEFQKGISDTWIAPIERPKELLGIGEEPDIVKKYRSKYLKKQDSDIVKKYRDKYLK